MLSHLSLKLAQFPCREFSCKNNDIVNGILSLLDRTETCHVTLWNDHVILGEYMTSHYPHYHRIRITFDLVESSHVTCLYLAILVEIMTLRISPFIEEGNRATFNRTWNRIERSIKSIKRVDYYFSTPLQGKITLLRTRDSFLTSFVRGDWYTCVKLSSSRLG